MGLFSKEQPRTYRFEELDVEELGQELLRDGKKEFQQKYPLTFLVSVTKSELDADLYAHRTVVATDLHEFDTVENPPMAKATPSQEPEKKICYAVAKSDRNRFTSKITVGRARNNDIVLRSQSISKLHAALIQGEQDDWQIADMGSTNGTKLNDRRLNKNQQVDLRTGDIVSFASFSFRFMTWTDFHKLLMESN